MLDMSELTKAEKPRNRSPGESAAEPPAAPLRREPSVRTHRDACGPRAAVRGAPGGGGDRGVPLWDQAEPVRPRTRTEDLLLRDALWDSHRRWRMLRVQGLARCVWFGWSQQQQLRKITRIKIYIKQKLWK